MTRAGDRPREPRPAAITLSAHHQDSTLVIDLAGDLAADTAPGLDLLSAALTRATRHVVVDTSGVDFVDGAGLRTLLRARHVCAGHGIDFVLRHPGPHLQWLMDITGTTELLLLPGPADPPADEQRSGGPAGSRSRPTGAAGPHTAEERERLLDEREHTAADREFLADEREKLLDEREHRVTAHQEWEDIREDLANQREQDLEQRERRLGRDPRDPGP
ncbi:STAS domain-containing protein [Actinoplanes sp. NEAU-A12]|uniref:STAS domain-containing protein n=1 Tax=Actinoplanes sandaracinus TaxID=3045177 RepID=A0ABT6WGW9_9ACTN|nr:STAS domain-containing protein [Actinoplanes sandaracinus]MDI6098962.1 STAS domain-containing protein [Actinoplanes sandaracinus]